MAAPPPMEEAEMLATGVRTAPSSESDVTVDASLSTYARRKPFPRTVAVDERPVERTMFPAGVMSGKPSSEFMAVALLAPLLGRRPRIVSAEMPEAVDGERIVPGLLVEPVDVDAVLWAGVRMAPPLEDEMDKLPSADSKDAA